MRRDEINFSITEGLRTLEDGDGEHAGSNPHPWLDVSNGRRYVERIRDTLVEIDPEGAKVYRATAENYLAEVKELDEYIRSRVQALRDSPGDGDRAGSPGSRSRLR